MSGPVDDDKRDALERLHALALRAHAGHPVPTLLRETVEEIVDLLGTGVAVIEEVDGSEAVTVAAAPGRAADDRVGRRRPAGELDSERAGAKRRGAAWVRSSASGTVVDVPLRSFAGTVAGNLRVELPPSTLPVTAQDLDFIAMVALNVRVSWTQILRGAPPAADAHAGGAFRATLEDEEFADIDRLVHRAAEELGSHFAARRVWVGTAWPGDYPGGATVGVWPSLPRPLPRTVDALRVSLVVSAYQAGRPVVMDAQDARARTPGGDLALLDVLFGGSAHLLVAPITGAGQLLGGITLASAPGASPPTVREVDAVTRFGRELGRGLLAARYRAREKELIVQLNDLDRYRRELIGTISHELKTPLTSIVGHAELLGEGSGGGPSIDAISRNAARLDRLVDQLLDFSRLYDDTAPLLEVVDVMALVDCAVAERRSRRTKGAWVHVVRGEGREGSDGTVSTIGDPVELRRVIDNILGNALRHAPEGGHVRLSVRQASGFIEIRCEEQGPSRPPRDGGVPGERQGAGGTAAKAVDRAQDGLGLVIAQRVAERHGGVVEVSSGSADLGAVVFRIPIAPAMPR